LTYNGSTLTATNSAIQLSVGNSAYGLNFGDVKLTCTSAAVDDLVIYNLGSSINDGLRFSSSTSYNYNEWAGLTYYTVGSAGTLKLGGPAAFRNNSVPFSTDILLTTQNANDLYIKAGGNVGLGTALPINRLHVYGSGSSSTNLGPTATFSSTEDQYPSFQILPYTHNNVNLGFDCYYSGDQWRSSTASNNSFLIYKTASTFSVISDLSTGIGSIINPFDYTSLQINGSNEVGVGGSATSSRTLTINSILASNRPAIKINNPNVDRTSSSTSKTFSGWLPIDLNGSGLYIPVYGP